jgi:hypothetical protein
MRYLGTLGLLTECSVYVPEDVRESIETAFEHACSADPMLKWRRILNRIEIEVDFSMPRQAAVPSTDPAPEIPAPAIVAPEYFTRRKPYKRRKRRRGIAP